MDDGINSEHSLENRALLWSITAGIMLILGVMVAITGLLVYYNRNAPQQPQPYHYDRSRRRGKGHHTKTTEGEYMNPRTDLKGSGHPQMPGKRPPTPSSSDGDSPTRSVAEHIYDLPECVIYENASESKSSGNGSPPLKKGGVDSA